MEIEDFKFLFSKTHEAIMQENKFNTEDWVFEYVTHYPGYRNTKTRVWIYKAKFDRMVRGNAEGNKGATK
jgi:3-deoxy-D-manno-octulosonic acid (KDO) 8-phosphate synthase